MSRHQPPPSLLLTRELFLKSGLPLCVMDIWQKPREVRHRHEFHELVLVTGGRGSHLTEDGKYPITRGHLYLVKPGQVHTYEDVRALRIINVLYDPQALALPLWDLPEQPGYRAFFDWGPRLRGHFRRQNGVTLAPGDVSRLEALLLGMERIQNKRAGGWKQAMTAQWMVFLGEVSQLGEHRETPTPVDRLGRILTYIEEHFEGEIRQEDLAACGGLSLSTLQRLFKNTLAARPMETLAQIRVEKAAEMLTRTSDPIGEIARKCGFTDGNYFSKQFHQRLGLTPREFRRRGSAAGPYQFAKPPGV